MIRVDRSKSYIDFSISSEKSAVAELLREAELFFDQFEIRDKYSMAIVLRELLLNAVIHGNKNMSGRIIKCSIEGLGKRKLRVEVEDEGDGFDYKALDMRLPVDPRRIQKRGYILINAVSDRIEFNTKGNRITAYVTINKEAIMV